jgi:hypothetical protein
VATKAKAKSRSKSKARATRKTAPATSVPNNPFAPGTVVGFHRPQTCEVERRANREPFAKPVKTAQAKRDGSLEVSGLDKGMWCAAGPVGDTWRYIGFSVK